MSMEELEKMAVDERLLGQGLQNYLSVSHSVSNKLSW